MQLKITGRDIKSSILVIKNHPEPEAILDIDPSILFVEDEKDALLRLIT